LAPCAAPGWIVVRQRGSHIRLQKREAEEDSQACRSKRSTLAHILKQARLTAQELQKFL
jgi:predicted RNA binding protein YcfA (HicA-like mRNA interferase family)